MTPEERAKIVNLLDELTYGQGPAYSMTQLNEMKTWHCPIHGTAARTVPAGHSNRTGRDYPAFDVCSTPNCEQRPPRQNGAGAPRTAPEAAQTYGAVSEPTNQLP